MSFAVHHSGQSLNTLRTLMYLMYIKYITYTVTKYCPCGKLYSRTLKSRRWDEDWMLRCEAASGRQEVEVVVGAVVIAPSNGHECPRAVSEKHGTMCGLWPDL